MEREGNTKYKPLLLPKNVQRVLVPKALPVLALLNVLFLLLLLIWPAVLQAVALESLLLFLDDPAADGGAANEEFRFSLRMAGRSCTHALAAAVRVPNESGPA